MHFGVIDTTRLIAGALWFVVWLLLSGSVVRSFTRQRWHLDPIWIIFWFLAGHQFGYVFRWFKDWHHVPIDGGDTQSLLGLHIMSSMIAIAIIATRVSFEGRRW